MHIGGDLFSNIHFLFTKRLEHSTVPSHPHHPTTRHRKISHIHETEKYDRAACRDRRNGCCIPCHLCACIVGAIAITYCVAEISDRKA